MEASPAARANECEIGGEWNIRTEAMHLARLAAALPFPSRPIVYVDDLGEATTQADVTAYGWRAIDVPAARARCMRTALAPALLRFGGLVLLAVVIAMGRGVNARADQMTWIVQSDYRYQVQVAVFSRNPRWEWPGHGNAYPLDDFDEHDIPISCQHGQKICYGAWVADRDDLI